MLAATGVAVYQRVTYDPLGAFVTVAVVLTAYTLGRRTVSRRMLTLVGAYTLAAVAAAGASGTAIATAPVAWIPIVLVPAVVGMFVTRTEHTTARLGATLAALEDEQALRAAQAVSEERNRAAGDFRTSSRTA